MSHWTNSDDEYFYAVFRGRNVGIFTNGFVLLIYFMTLQLNLMQHTHTHTLYAHTLSEFLCAGSFHGSFVRVNMRACAS
jgi:hypothetical protein